MIKFKLDPPSGYTNSYQDIRFEVFFPKSEQAEIRLFNDTLKQQLEILSVTQGYIQNENVVISKNVSSVEGFINIFNRDKMNIMLNHYTSVDIRCEVICDSGRHESSQTFYNESKSLDSQVVPFDISIQNADNIQNGAPMRLSLVCDSERKFELSIRDGFGTRNCTFEIYAHRGTTTVDVPAEVIYYDLRLAENKSAKTFNLYWTKFEGFDYSKFMNRKHILLANTSIVLAPGKVARNPQTRIGPVGELPGEFVLSDRYFVHTHKTFSGFGEKALHPIRMKRLTFFMHEAQDIQSKSDDVMALAIDERKSKLAEMQHLMKQEQLKKKPRHLGVSAQKQFLESFSPIYNKRAADSMPMAAVVAQPTTPALAPARKSGGCSGCGRKR